jgi:hypothetical protein
MVVNNLRFDKIDVMGEVLEVLWDPSSFYRRAVSSMGYCHPSMIWAKGAVLAVLVPIELHCCTW